VNLANSGVNSAGSGVNSAGSGVNLAELSNRNLVRHLRA
jgi:hypothetical protein